MNELLQWCEIDGHSWIESHLIHGLVLGSKQYDIYKRCQRCGTEEHKIVAPLGSDKYLFPIQMLITKEEKK